jgi:hypothetical protein
MTLPTLQPAVIRFNRRTSGSRGLVFLRLIQQAVDLDRVPANEIRGGRQPMKINQLMYLESSAYPYCRIPHRAAAGGRASTPTGPARDRAYRAQKKGRVETPLMRDEMRVETLAARPVDAGARSKIVDTEGEGRPFRGVLTH